MVGEDKEKVVGKIFSHKIPILIPRKPIQTKETIVTSSAVVNPKIEIDISKLQSKKGLTINEGSSFIVKLIITSSKDKGKDVEPIDEENKRLKELEIGKLKHMNSFLRQRENDPIRFNNGDMNKTQNYDTIE